MRWPLSTQPYACVPQELSSSSKLSVDWVNTINPPEVMCGALLMEEGNAIQATAREASDSIIYCYGNGLLGQNLDI